MRLRFTWLSTLESASKLSIFLVSKLSLPGLRQSAKASRRKSNSWKMTIHNPGGDLFVSVGMLEHIGRDYYQEFSRVIHRAIGDEHDANLAGISRVLSSVDS